MSTDFADDLWAGDDLGEEDDDLPDDDAAFGNYGDRLIGLFDVASEDDRREFFGSDVFMSWLKGFLKTHGVKSVAETAPPPARVQPTVSAAALRLAQKAAAIWESGANYP